MRPCRRRCCQFARVLRTGNLASAIRAFLNDRHRYRTLLSETSGAMRQLPISLALRVFFTERSASSTQARERRVYAVRRMRSTVLRSNVICLLHRVRKKKITSRVVRTNWQALRMLDSWSVVLDQPI
jgi:hypothetical protein